MSFRRITILLTCLLVVGMGFGAPANAAKARIGLVQAVGLSTSSITITWPKVAKAKKYQVVFATTFAMKNSTTKSAGKKRTYTIKGLKAGENYCMFVRVSKGKSKGVRSARYCKPTITQKGATSGTKLTVMTYNVCSDKGRCGATWAQRQPAATELIASRAPDVVGVQEANNDPYIGDGLATKGYAQAIYSNAKALYYKTATYEPTGNVGVQSCGDDINPWYDSYDPNLDDMYESDATATTDSTDRWYNSGSGDRVWKLKGPDANRADHNGEVGYAPNCATGLVHMGSYNGDRYAVWAELRSKQTHKSFLFVSAHTTSGKGAKYDRQRLSEINNLIAQINAVNTKNLPVVYLGDFNSHKGRDLDGPGQAFKANGYVDAFDNSTSLIRPNYNSYNNFQSNPITSYTYGDHVDHIYVKPTVGMSTWESVANFSKKKYVGVIPSDHNPVRVTLTIR
ncbi:hypothetical protein BH09ACT10_BH09ACT10_23860 [soil metagenome]